MAGLSLKGSEWQKEKFYTLHTASDAQWHRRGCQCFCRGEKYGSGNAKSPVNDTGDTGTLKQSSREKAGKALSLFCAIPLISPGWLCLVILWLSRRLSGKKCIWSLGCVANTVTATVLEMDVWTLRRSVSSDIPLVATIIVNPINRWKKCPKKKKRRQLSFSIRFWLVMSDCRVVPVKQGLSAAGVLLNSRLRDECLCCLLVMLESRGLQLDEETGRVEQWENHSDFRFQKLPLLYENDAVCLSWEGGNFKVTGDCCSTLWSNRW